MDKNQLLALINQSLQSGVITHDEVVKAVTVGEYKKEAVKLSTVNILYMIGGLILIVGIITLVYKFWGDLSSVVRILITLGLAISAHISGIILYTKGDKEKGIATVMQVISGVLAPVGIAVLLSEMHVVYSYGLVASMAILLTVVYGLSLVLFRSVIFSFFTILFGTCAVYTSVGYILSLGGPITDVDKIYEYLTLVVGTAYLFIASYVKNTSHKELAPVLTSFGALGINSAILTLGGYSPRQSIIWELIGVLSLVGGLYLASTRQDQNILKVTGLFIFIYIGKFTAEYFADSFGWPFALIFGGLVLIGAGYGLVKFGKSLRIS